VNEAARKGTYFVDELRKIQQLYPDIVKDIRGKGLMIGMEFFPTKKGYEEKYGPFYAVEVERYLQDEYRIQIIHTINNPSTFRFLPPLNVPQEDIDYTIKAFASAIKYIKEVTKDEISA
jgi:putrescine aminotransferase